MLRLCWSRVRCRSWPTCFRPNSGCEGESAARGRVGASKRQLRALHPSASIIPFKVTGRRTVLQDRDSWMSNFLAFLNAAAEFALALNLKAAIVAAGFIVMLVLTR